MPGTRSLPVLSALLLLLLLLPALAGCTSTPEEPLVGRSPGLEEDDPPAPGPAAVPEQKLLDPNRILARVNGRVITVRTILATDAGDAIKQADPEEEEGIRRVLERATREVIIDFLEEEEAKRLGIRVTKEDLERIWKATDEDVRAERGVSLEEDLLARGIPRWQWDEDQRRRILQGRFMTVALGFAGKIEGRPELRARADVYVSPEEVRAAYDRNPEAWRVPERARVDAIFVRDYEFEREGVSPAEAQERARSHAEGILRRIRGGESFEAVRAQVQKEPVKGFEEPFERGGHQPYVEDFAWSARVGEVSDLIPTRSGFLILRLAERQSERVLPFAEVRERIGQRLAELRQTEAILKIRGDLVKAAVITPRQYRRQLLQMFAEESAKVLEELSR